MKKLGVLVATTSILVSSFVAPIFAANYWFGSQRQTGINVSGGDVWWSWSEWFLSFVQSGVNWILSLLWLITVIILIYGGFQMVTAAGDDWKYKKWFTIVKQAVIGLILIGVSAMIVNLIFSFVTSNSSPQNQAWGWNNG